MTVVAQRSFAGGEISPSLYARVDFSKYISSARTLRNFITLRHGGAANRPGTNFVGEVSDSSLTVRLVPFIFNNSQTYVLEFGNLYMRVIKDGGYITETGQTVTGATQADPVVITITGHLYSNGDEVYMSGIGGMNELNNRNFKVANVTANTFELQLMDGSTNLDGTGFSAFTSGGTASKMYEIVTTYATADLSTLNYVQSADIVTIAHATYPPREVARTGDASWSITDLTFEPSITRPNGGAVTSITAGSNRYQWKVTAVKEETFEESLAGRELAVAASGATQADPVVVTTATHSYTTGDEVYISDIVGMTELNDRKFFITVLTGTTFELDDEDGTGHTAYSSGGTSARTFLNANSAAVGTLADPHILSWTAVAGAQEYNVYESENGIYGLVGVAGTNSFNVIGTLPDTGNTPPIERNPFSGVDNYPSTVTYYQQRLLFANTNNDVEKIFGSKSGDFKNFTVRSPLQDDDSITFTMAGQKVNAVKHMLGLGSLVVLTESAEQAVEGDEAGILKPTSLFPKPYSYYGSGTLKPISIGGNALYVQTRGSIVRDLGFDFQIDGYRGNDLTIISSHLFEGITLVDWAYQQVPHSILWCVRSDGILLGLTYVREQQMFAWHRHDFKDGLVENVVVVPEGQEDVLYVVVKRTINSIVTRFVEKLVTRYISDVKDSKFMDSHLSFDGRNSSATTMTLTGGTLWVYTETLTLTSSVAYFVAGDVGNEIHYTDPDGVVVIRLTITGFTSTTIVSVQSNKTVPASHQATALSSWTKAVDEVTGLWHLEGEDVSVFGDGFVVASPNNASYDTITITGGIATLDKPYGVIHVGLPYFSDLETLDIDSADGSTMADKNKLITDVTLFVEKSRGIWVGERPPAADTVDPLQDLTELKIRDMEGYDEPVDLATGPVELNIKGRWNNNGRVFIRQVDPVPLTVLAVMPSGELPFKKRGS